MLVLYPNIFYSPGPHRRSPSHVQPPSVGPNLPNLARSVATWHAAPHGVPNLPPHDLCLTFSRPCGSGCAPGLTCTCSQAHDSPTELATFILSPPLTILYSFCIFTYQYNCPYCYGNRSSRILLRHRPHTSNVPVSLLPKENGGETLIFT
jgi:hypothetical protein